MQTIYNFSEKTCGCKPGECENCKEETAFEEIKDDAVENENASASESWKSSAASLLVSTCAGLTVTKITSKMLKMMIGNKIGVVGTIGVATISVLTGAHVAVLCERNIRSWKNAIEKTSSRR